MWQHGKSILKSAMPNPNGSSPGAQTVKKDADYVFYELTRSICPVCRAVIDAQILIRDNKVYMRKRCAQHGSFEALVYTSLRRRPSANRRRETKLSGSRPN